METILNICALSDFHGLLPKVPECDLCIIAGDVCPQFDHSEMFQQSWIETSFKLWLEEIPARHIVGIAGNHDFIFEMKKINLPWNYLEDSSVEIEGIKIHGTPHVNGTDKWAFSHEEFVLKQIWENLPYCDILISHSPPYGIADDDKRGNKIGSISLRRQIGKLKIPMVICGHAHENYGLHKMNDCEVLNVAMAYNKYDSKSVELAHETTMYPYDRKTR
jgi:Icc-related predicted phosphoesterase